MKLSYYSSSLFIPLSIFLLLYACQHQTNETAPEAEYQVPDRFTPELLWKLGRIGDLDVSPDGSTLLFHVTNYNLEEDKGNKDIFSINVHGGKPTQLSSDTENESMATWRPDGNKIGYLFDDGEGSQLWEMDPDGKNKVKISNIENGIGLFKYASTLGHILFTTDVKLDSTVNDLYPDLPKANARIIDNLMYRHWNAWHDFSYSHIFVAEYKEGALSDPVDIMEGERYDSPLNPFGGAEQICWSPDGKTIAYACKKMTGKNYTESTNSDIYLYQLESGETTNLTTGMNGYDLDPVFSPSGNRIAWVSMEKDGFESDRSRIFVHDLESSSTVELTEGFDQSASHLVWSLDESKIYFISGVSATYQMFSIEVVSNEVKQLTAGQHNYKEAYPAGKFLVGRKMSMSYPSEIYRVNLETQEEEQLTFVNDQILSKVKTGNVEERHIQTSDGKDMLVWVIYPPDFDSSLSYPTLLYCQGGPQSAVSQFFSFRWNFQLMTASNYIVVAPNRRGLPSFGQQWNDQISGDWGGQAMKDYLSAIDALAEEPYVDASRLGAIGASYGGYSVYWLAGNHDKRFKSFISHCGLFNLESWYGSTEEMFFANWDLKGAYWDNPQPKSYAQFSPHKFAGNWDTPMLVIHGEKDFRVPVAEGMQAFSAAQLQGIPSRFLYYPEEGHWILKPQNGVLWHRIFFDWLGRSLK